MVNSFEGEGDGESETVSETVTSRVCEGVVVSDTSFVADPRDTVKVADSDIVPVTVSDGDGVVSGVAVLLAVPTEGEFVAVISRVGVSEGVMVLLPMEMVWVIEALSEIDSEAVSDGDLETVSSGVLDNEFVSSNVSDGDEDCERLVVTEWDSDGSLEYVTVPEREGSDVVDVENDMDCVVDLVASSEIVPRVTEGL